MKIVVAGRFLFCAQNASDELRLIFVESWREYGNRFFELSETFLQGFDLFGGKNFAVVGLDCGIEVTLLLMADSETPYSRDKRR